LRKIRIKNPFSVFFKPKEKPDDPLARIPEEWKKKKSEPTDDGQEKVVEVTEAKRKPGRPSKKAEVLVPPTDMKQTPKMKSTPQPQEKKSFIERLPQRRPVKLRSYQTRFKFKSIPHFRTIKRWLAALLLVGMILSAGVLFFVAPYYSPIAAINGFLLLDYIWVTGIPKVPKETIKFKDPQMFADWLKKQNVVFEVNNKEEE